MIFWIRVGLLAALVAGSGWLGYYVEHLRFKAYVAKDELESTKVALAAVRVADEKAAQLSHVSMQLEAQAYESKTQIDDALAANRKLASSLRMRPACPVPASGVSQTTGPSAVADETADNGFSGACAELLSEVAADADRNADQVLAGQEWSGEVKRVINQEVKP